MTGTTPFSDKSDEDISAEVIRGLRPEWPSDDSSQALIDALWSQVEVCWCYDPEERPTALMAFQYLQNFVRKRDQERHRDTQESPEHSDDQTWDHLEDAQEFGSFESLGSEPRD